MAKIGTMRNSRKQQRLNAEFGSIVDHMATAMWAANRKYIASHELPLTENMNMALREFQDFCVRNPE